MELLNYRLRSTCMIRRLKSAVLKDLPAKRRQIIELPNAFKALTSRELVVHANNERVTDELRAAVERARLTGSEEEHRRAVADLKAGMSAGFTEMAALRKAVGLAKLPMCCEHIIETLEEVESLVIFVWHRDVGNGVYAALRAEGISMGVISGQTGQADRDRAVQEFQAGRLRVMLGSLGAAGVGITLTKSSHIVFVESDWVPSVISQAEDRCARIGQKFSLLAQHLVLEGSMDASMAKRCVEKQTVIDAALDGGVA